MLIGYSRFIIGGHLVLRRALLSGSFGFLFSLFQRFFLNDAWWIKSFYSALLFCDLMNFIPTSNDAWWIKSFYSVLLFYGSMNYIPMFNDAWWTRSFNSVLLFGGSMNYILMFVCEIELRLRLAHG